MALPGIDTTLEEMLTCGQCSKVYTEPRTLPCQHTFCRACLEKQLAMKLSPRKNRSRVIICSECKESTSLEEQRVGDLPTSFAVENLIEINRKFKLMEDMLQEKQELKSEEEEKERDTDNNKKIHQSMPLQSYKHKQERSLTINNQKPAVISGLKYPWGITKGCNKDQLIVSEWGGDRITVLDQEREKRFSFGHEQLVKPRGVAITRGGEDIIATSFDRLIRFTADGTHIRTVGSKGDTPLQFQCPTGVAVHPLTGAVYIADADNHRIQVISPELTTFLRTFGDTGELAFPWDIAFDSSGSVYVADGNGKVQTFTADGAYIGQFSSCRGRGSSKQLLNRHSSIIIDRENRVYLTELRSNRVSVYDRSGELERCYTGTDSLALSGPCGLTIDAASSRSSSSDENIVYVTDCWNDRVVTFWETYSSIS